MKINIMLQNKHMTHHMTQASVMSRYSDNRQHRRNCCHRTNLIEYKVFPLLAPESVVVLNDKLVWCDADVECIRFGPTLNDRLFTANNQFNYLHTNGYTSQCLLQS